MGLHERRGWTVGWLGGAAAESAAVAWRPSSPMLTPILRGWFGYFKHAHRALQSVDGLVRRRLRANPPVSRRADPDEETTDWRDVCGRTACTVRRSGRTRVIPDLLSMPKNQRPKCRHRVTLDLPQKSRRHLGPLDRRVRQFGYRRTGHRLPPSFLTMFQY